MVWLKIKELYRAKRRFWSLVPFPFGANLVHVFEPRPCWFAKGIYLVSVLLRSSSGIDTRKGTVCSHEIFDAHLGSGLPPAGWNIRL